MRKYLLLLILFIFYSNSYAQIPESCNCLVDTIGYSNFIETLNPNENANFQFHVNGTFAVAYGVIGSSTPAAVQDLIDNHPSITTIVMYACPGSENDVANLEAAMLIYNQGYKMYLPNNGWIASGATDMFLAGSVRVVEVTFDPVGVHSWSDGVNEATDFPEDHAYHQPYINYYVDVGFTQQEAEDFYFFTINAAPANGIHWMTDAEIDQYKIRTCRYSENPTYSLTQNGNSLTANLSGATYQWFDCITNTAITGSTEQTFVANSNGEYAVLITEDSCASMSDCYTITVAGVMENNFGNEFLLYPNPTNGDFSMDLQKIYPSISIKMLDLKGTLIQSYEYKQSQLINLAIEEPVGVYMLVIESEDKKAVIRLVKK